MGNPKEVARMKEIHEDMHNIVSETLEIQQSRVSINLELETNDMLDLCCYLKRHSTEIRDSEKDYGELAGIYAVLFSSL